MRVMGRIGRLEAAMPVQPKRRVLTEAELHERNLFAKDKVAIGLSRDLGDAIRALWREESPETQAEVRKRAAALRERMRMLVEQNLPPAAPPRPTTEDLRAKLLAVMRGGGSTAG